MRAEEVKRALGIGFLAGIVFALAGLGCKEWLDAHDPPVCPPSDPNCDCMDRKRHIGCSDNWADDVNGCVSGENCPTHLARDAGADARDGGDAR